MSNPSSTNTISAALDEIQNKEQAFQAATAATVRALGLAPAHEVHFGRVWQSGYEQTEFPMLADDATLRGLADLQAAALRFHHDYAVPDFSPAQKEFFGFLEDARRAACLSQRYVGARQNILNLWAQDPVIDFKTLEDNGPSAELLNEVINAARHLWLGQNDVSIQPFLQMLLQQLRMDIFTPDKFLQNAKKLIDTVWQQPQSCPSQTPEAEMPNAVSHAEDLNNEQQSDSPLALQSEDETEAPAATGAAQADETELRSDVSQSEDGTHQGFHNPVAEAASALARYHVYTTQYDEVIPASTLMTTLEQQKLRNDLETQLQPFQRLVHKLAQQLQQQLQSWEASGWQRGLDDGLLDLQRLSRVYTHTRGAQLIFKQPHLSLARDCVVTLLLDNSGSMRGRPILITALCADILAHTLERCGVKVEILGYTTKQWKGGQPFRDWQQVGKPDNPGRLNELRHIVYKSADQSWRQARLSIATMLKEGLLKENIDGEALLWAHQRLAKRREKRKILMVISDGAPVDDATLAANRPNYLEEHLHDTIAWINAQAKTELVAIGIGHDVTRYYPRAVVIKDVETLAQTMLDELGKLLKK